MEGAFVMLLTPLRNETEELKMLSQNGFQECFQKFYSRGHKCLFAHESILMGHVA
jgi:hypothetical protein